MQGGVDMIRARQNPNTSLSLLKRRDEFIQVAHTKRFLEYWASDSTFREELDRNARSAATRRGLLVDPEHIRPLWDRNFCQANSNRPFESASHYPLVDSYIRVREHKQSISERMRIECAPLDPRFARWRERQVARARTEFAPDLFCAIQHPAFAIELGDGCSVGCWFCGVSAAKLTRQFRYTTNDAKAWRELMEIIVKFAGTVGGSRSLLYWATDPFDNPDYEHFAEDFKGVFGAFPHTTTAQAHKDLPRTRSFLRYAGPDDPFLLRISVLSLGALRQLHEHFTAEELAFVELIPQTAGSLIKKVASGKARSSSIQRPSLGSQLSQGTGRTISCVSGFLINLVTRNLKMISPCGVSIRWPQGYYIYDESEFDNMSDLETAVDRMISRHMPLRPYPDARLRFRHDLRFEHIMSGFRLIGRHGEQSFSGPFLGELATMIMSEEATPTKIEHRFAREYGFDEDVPRAWLDNLFAAGVIAETPEEVDI